MMQSRLTLNINCSYVKDWNKTREFLRKLDPVCMVAVIDNLDNKNRILEIKQDLPNAKIIARCIIVVNDNGQQKELDGSMHTKPQDDRYWLVSPGNFLDKWGELGQGGLSLSYMNEPQVFDARKADIDRQVQHMIETIGLATARGISLVVGNWGVGHDLEDKFDNIIEIVGKHPELHSLGFHGYAPIDTYKFIDNVKARCQARGFAVPKIHITEFGYDNGGAGDPLNGYKSRGYSGVQFAGWCIEKTKNFYSTYIQDGILESVAVFGWGYAASFAAFDVETDADWQATILDASQKGLLSVTKKPVTKPFITPMPKPVDVMYPKRIRVTNVNGINLRSGASTDYQQAGELKKGDEVTLYDYPMRQASNKSAWRWVDVSDTVGGWVCTDVLSYEGVVIPTPPPVVIPPITQQMVYMMTASERASALSLLGQLSDLFAGLQERAVTSEQKAA